MASSNRLVFFMVFLIVTFMMYKAASGHANIVENWGWTMVPMTAKVDTVRQGASKPGNNQDQLFYNQNQFINTSLLDPTQLSVLQQSINPALTSATSLNVGQTPLPKNSPQSMITNYNITNENYEGPNPGIPVYTVPGTYQADLSPRFNSAGLNSYVKYNLPEQQNLASYPNDPLTVKHRPRENYQPMDLVNMVEKPQVREGFQSDQTASGKQYAQMTNKLAEQGAEVVSKLPVQPMTSNTVGGTDKEPIYYNADRYIFALQKSRLYGLADYIRGDLPVIPCLPNSNPNSNTWFRPSAQPRVDLNPGAIGIIAGVNNVGQQQTVELMARAAGGSPSVLNGVNSMPIDTPIANVAAVQQAQMANLDMNWQAHQTVDQPNPISMVSTTASTP